MLDAEIVAGNTLYQILLFFGFIFVSWVIGRVGKLVIQKYSVRLAEKERKLAAISMESIAASLVPFAIVCGIKLGSLSLNLGTDRVESFVVTSINVLIVLAVAFLCFNLVDVPDHIFSEIAKKTKSKMDDMLVPIVRKSLRLTVFLLALLQIAQLLSGKELSAIVAGLGVGGLAFALAAQDTIKNFFGSLVIFSDKPFELGERINVDGHDGTVEEVGLRSTRVRRLDGHLVTFPNGELANKPIWNIARRPFIRNIFNITVTYDTPPDKLVEAKAILEDILKDHEGMNPEFPPRVYFQELASTSLNFMVIYWYHPPAYWDYMAFTERTNLEIVKRFNEAGIEFAFPTQTVHVVGNDDKQSLGQEALS